MVNASLNWASIVGIVLAVCGAGLYFLRSFKPALARDYDVFFAAIGLLCGGILFFQGWRLDPILQFGQFLLAGTTVFFAYESVRLRGVATDQARRSSYFDDEPEPSRMGSGGSRMSWDENNYDQFDDAPSPRRRFSGANSPESADQEDFYRTRRPSRRVIPEEAVSRRLSNTEELDDSWNQRSVTNRRRERFRNSADEQENKSTFGDRRNSREQQKRGTRPSASKSPSTGRRNSDINSAYRSSSSYTSPNNSRSSRKPSIDRKTEDAAYSPTSTRTDSPKGVSNRSRRNTDAMNSRSRSSSTSGGSGSSPSSSQPRTRNSRNRDNNSRFDD